MMHRLQYFSFLSPPQPSLDRIDSGGKECAQPCDRIAAWILVTFRGGPAATYVRERRMAKRELCGLEGDRGER